MLLLAVPLELNNTGLGALGGIWRRCECVERCARAEAALRGHGTAVRASATAVRE
eukprot:SAG11_NODE_34796_length_270_cov_0.602339_1_plen_54_part_01